VDPRGEPRSPHSGRQRTQLPENRSPRSNTIIGPSPGLRWTRHRRMNHEAERDIDGGLFRGIHEWEIGDQARLRLDRRVVPPTITIARPI
jgi:hypothetical protein